MRNSTQQLLEITASLQSRGVALSEWVDSQPEPWSMALRFLPITVVFLLGLVLALLWQRKPRSMNPVDSAEKLFSLQNELRASLQKNKSQQEQIASAGRALKIKERELDKLRAQLSAAGGVDKVAVEKMPAKAVPVTGAELVPRQDLRKFAAASEKLAEAASRLRGKIKADADGKSAEAMGSSQVGPPPDWEELVVFRCNDPSIWNQAVDEGEDRHAVPLAQVPDNAAFLRLRRLDTGEAVVVPVGAGDLTQDGGGRGTGFNGSKEEFYGARHLGVYQEGLPQEVEIRFAYGGWGFGHRADGEPSQALGWAGHEISNGTVIEITVFPRMPEMPPRDRLLAST